MTRCGAILAGFAIAGVAVAASASAHVTITAPGATAGAADVSITVRVPTESGTASTTGLRLQLPTATPIAGILLAPTPGWTAKVIHTTLPKPIHTDDGDISEVVSEIDWSATTEAGIAPGYFGQFTIIAGKLPDGVRTLTFKAIQTYSNGKVVSWIQVPASGSTAEPDFPAPTLALAAASDPTPGTSSTTGPSSSPAITTTTASAGADAASKSAAITGIVLGAVGIVLGALALVLVVSRRRADGERGGAGSD